MKRGLGTEVASAASVGARLVSALMCIGPTHGSTPTDCVVAEDETYRIRRKTTYVPAPRLDLNSLGQ